MNSSIFIFGSFSYGYTQFPGDEYIATITNTVVANSSSISRLATYRDANLMYYIYLRYLDNDKDYIGFCVQLNSTSISDIKPSLFNLFEKIIEEIVLAGKIIKFDEYGNIVSNTIYLYNLNDEIEPIFNKIRKELALLNTTSLPPINYGLERDKISLFLFLNEDNSKKITKATLEGGYVIIDKIDQYNTTKMDSYKNTLSRISKENEYLRQENAKINRKKQQFTYVIALCIGIIICVIGILFLDNDRKEKESTINSTKKTLYQTEQNLKGLNQELIETRALNENLSSELANKTTELNNKNALIKSLENTIKEREDEIKALETALHNFHLNYYGPQHY